jgi:type I restriction enzyme S subunit
VVRLQNIGCGEFKGNDAAYISEGHWLGVIGGGHDVVPGDVLIAGLGDENNPLGRACVAPGGLGKTIVKADCYRFRLGPRANSVYIAWLLSSTATSECGYLATGATRDRLNLGIASARVVVLPPVVEQERIVEALARRLARLDLLDRKTKQSIVLLKERRSALITAAVTGKIDLRESA